MSRGTWFLVRLDLLRRPVAVLVLTALIALLFGGAVASAIGARRSATSLDRFIAFTQLPTVSVAGAPETIAAIDGLPGIASSVGGAYLGMAPVGSDGKPELDLLGSINPIVLKPYVGGPEGMQQVQILDGRALDQTQPLEILIDEQVARERGLAVGGTLTMVGFSPKQVAEDLGAGETGALPQGAKVAFKVVGIERALSDVDPAEPAPEVIYLGTADILISGTFLDRYGDSVASLGFPGFDFREIRLDNGAAGLPAFTNALRSLPGGADVEVSTEFDSVGAIVATQGAIVVETVSLWALAVAFLVATILVAIPGIGRLARRSSADLAVARTLGQTPSETVAVASAPGVVVALAAPALGALVGFAASPLTPVGLARQAEIAPGLRFDPLIVLPAALLLAGTLALVAVVSARRVVGSIGTNAQAASGATRVRRLRWRGPLPSTLGVGIAGRRGSVSAVPLRSAALVLGFALLVTAGVGAYTASLSALTRSPAEQGWAWDLAVGNPNSCCTPEDEQRLLADPNVDKIAAVSTPSADVNVGGTGMQVGAFIPVRGDLTPDLIQGDIPAAKNEILLGHQTMDNLGVQVGDRIDVMVGEKSRSMRVVGSAVLSSAINSSFTMGNGGLVSLGQLQEITEAQVNSYLVTLKPGIDRDVAVRELQATWGRTILTPRTPSGIVNLTRVQLLPIVFAGILLAVALVLFGWTLFAGVRRRREDLVLFRAVGATRGQLAGAIGWQATWVVGWAVVVGVPLGLVLGRIAWARVADTLGTFAAARVGGSWAVTTLVAVAVVAVLIALGPAWSATRVRAVSDVRRD